MTTDKLRAKFEAWANDYALDVEPLTRASVRADCLAAYQAGYTSRDAEVEALRKDAERWRSLVAENNKGRHGKFRICWLDPSHEGFITTDGVSCAGKDEEAIVRIFDAVMREE